MANKKCVVVCVLPQCDWSRTLTQHTGARPTILVICPSWSEVFSPLERPAPLPASVASGKGYLGPIRALEVEIDLGVRGSPVYSLTLRIKLEGLRAP